MSLSFIPPPPHRPGPHAEPPPRAEQHAPTTTRRAGEAPSPEAYPYQTNPIPTRDYVPVDAALLKPFDPKAPPAEFAPTPPVGDADQSRDAPDPPSLFPAVPPSHFLGPALGIRWISNALRIAHLLSSARYRSNFGLQSICDPTYKQLRRADPDAGRYYTFPLQHAQELDRQLAYEIRRLPPRRKTPGTRTVDQWPAAAPPGPALDEPPTNQPPAKQPSTDQLSTEQPPADQPPAKQTPAKQTPHRSNPIPETPPPNATAAPHPHIASSAHPSGDPRQPEAELRARRDESLQVLAQATNVLSVAIESFNFAAQSFQAAARAHHQSAARLRKATRQLRKTTRPKAAATRRTRKPQPSLPIPESTRPVAPHNPPTERPLSRVPSSRHFISRGSRRARTKNSRRTTGHDTAGGYFRTYVANAAFMKTLCLLFRKLPRVLLPVLLLVTFLFASDYGRNDRSPVSPSLPPPATSPPKPIEPVPRAWRSPPGSPRKRPARKNASFSVPRRRILGDPPCNDVETTVPPAGPPTVPPAGPSTRPALGPVSDGCRNPISVPEAPSNRHAATHRALPSKVAPQHAPPMNLPETNPQLIVRLRDPADERAWTEFVELYRPAIVRLAGRKGLQPHDCEDLAQSVLAAVAGAIDRWQPDGPARFRTWLYTVANRQVIDALRKRASAAECGGSDVRRRIDQQPEPADDSRLLRLELRRRLFERAASVVRSEFAPESWAAFRLTAVDGLSADAAAAQIGKTVGAVYAAKGRVMRRLLEYVETLTQETGIDCPEV